MTPTKPRAPIASIRERRARGGTDPHAELVALRARLDEAEEALRAIRSGEVDALVVTTRIGEQIFTLRSAEQPYRIFVESMSEGAVTLSGDGTILYSNARFAEMMALPLARVTGAAFGDFVATAQQATFAALLARGQHERCAGEIELAAAEGASVMVQLSVHPLETDALRGMCVVVTDITAYKRAEEALEASTAAFRTLGELVPQLVWMCTPDGLNIYFNQRWVDYTGLTLQESYGRGWNTPFHPDDKQPAWDAWNHAVATGDTYRIECRLRAADGSYRWFLTKGVPQHDASGRIVRWFGTCTDIEDLKQAEAKLRESQRELALRAQELARSNADLQEFAYVASHDLQEPLRMVASYVKLLASRYRGHLDADADDFIAFAVDGATRMQRLIGDLLEYSRVGTQAKDLSPTACDTVLEHVLNNLQVMIEDTHAVITHDPLPTVLADDVQLAQVLQNLIGNAIKFHAEAPPHVHVSAERHDTAWRFAVRDNGIGIDPQHFEHIFVIFQRLHAHDAYPGTGIGLAICKRIIERHHGRIWVESAPGQGATFFFTIPDRAGEEARE
jgi:PAS domain S-box-containing protein